MNDGKSFGRPEYPRIFSEKANLCLEEVSLWMEENELELVPSKTEAVSIRRKWDRKVWLDEKMDCTRVESVGVEFSSTFVAIGSGRHIGWQNPSSHWGNLSGVLCSSLRGIEISCTALRRRYFWGWHRQTGTVSRGALKVISGKIDLMLQKWKQVYVEKMKKEEKHILNI